MGSECGECERDLRGGHDVECSRWAHFELTTRPWGEEYSPVQVVVVQQADFEELRKRVRILREAHDRIPKRTIIHEGAATSPVLQRLIKLQQELCEYGGLTALAVDHDGEAAQVERELWTLVNAREKEFQELDRIARSNGDSVALADAHIQARDERIRELGEKADALAESVRLHHARVEQLEEALAQAKREHEEEIQVGEERERRVRSELMRPPPFRVCCTPGCSNQPPADQAHCTVCVEGAKREVALHDQVIQWQTRANEARIQAVNVIVPTWAAERDKLRVALMACCAVLEGRFPPDPNRAALEYARHVLADTGGPDLPEPDAVPEKPDWTPESHLRQCRQTLQAYQQGSEDVPQLYDDFRYLLTAAERIFQDQARQRDAMDQVLRTLNAHLQCGANSYANQQLYKELLGHAKAFQVEGS